LRHGSLAWLLLLPGCGATRQNAVAVSPPERSALEETSPAGSAAVPAWLRAEPPTTTVGAEELDWAHARHLRWRPKEPERPWTGPHLPLSSFGFLLDQEDAGGAGEPERWSSFLPLLGDRAAERGYKLPLPFGVGGYFLFLERPSEITGLRIGLNGNPPQEIKSIGIEPTASVQNFTGRFDVWILPMVNVYGLAGYIWNESDTLIRLDLPGSPGTPLTLSGELEGPVYGGGATVAGGYKELFATLDANYSESELGNLSTMRAFLATLRLGWNTELEGTSIRFWTGSTYWGTKRTIKGQFDALGNTVAFEVDQEPRDPVTINLGTNVTPADYLMISLDFQFWRDTRALTGGVAFRF